jgi:predicted SAM-dependent methyltransferase
MLSSRKGCCICRSNDQEKLIDSFDMSTISDTAKGTLFKCRSCGFLGYDVSNVNSETFDSYYRNLAKYDEKMNQAGSGCRDWDRERLFETIEEVLDKVKLNPTDLIFDIGCGGGGGLSTLEERGFSNLWGLDVKDNRTSEVRASSRIRFSEFSFSTSTFEPELPQSAKLILLMHVLEHIYDLENMLSKLYKLSSGDTVIYVEVPDSRRYSAFYKTPFHYFSEEHVNHFDGRTLRMLFERSGFVQVPPFEQERLEKTIRVSSSEHYPAVSSFFMKADLSYISDYILKSKMGLKSSGEVASLLVNLKPIAVWGIGSTMRRLFFDKELLDNVDPLYLVDQSDKLVGHSYLGRQIHPPSVLGGFGGTVLITASIFSAEITAELSFLAPMANVLTLNDLLSRP